MYKPVKIYWLIFEPDNQIDPALLLPALGTSSEPRRLTGPGPMPLHLLQHLGANL